MQSQSAPPGLAIPNLRVVKLLVADAPANFVQSASDAGLCYVEEAVEWGTRYVLDFADLSAANQSSALVRKLVAIAADPEFREFTQISLETK